jgi:hypothetical protein
MNAQNGGEYLVGAYLQLEEKCDFVTYNVRPPGGGQEGLREFDVLGLNFKSNTAYLCEVTTHIRGLHRKLVDRVKDKHNRQKDYANKHLKNFKKVIFQFWSPVVPVGYRTKGLAQIKGLELIINGEYKARVDRLRELAKECTYDACNPEFRVLQILAHLRD